MSVRRGAPIPERQWRYNAVTYSLSLTETPFGGLQHNGLWENRPAIEVLVERHEQRVLAIAWCMTGTREDAEDVLQQAFQKAFTHLRKFEDRSSFSSLVNPDRPQRRSELASETNLGCDLLFVILDNLCGTDLRLIWIFPKLSQSTALAQEIPALVELDL